MPRSRRRHGFSFGISTLLVIVTVFGAWLGWHVRRVGQQKRAVAWVKAVGGTVQYDYEWDEDGWIPDAELPGPDWLCQLIGVDHFASIAEVSLYDGDVRDLSPLYELNNLNTLVLWGPAIGIPDEVIAALEKALPDCEIAGPCVSWFDEEVERNFDDAVLKVGEPQL